jgi:2-hydroxy-3-keto-5-methylthiopentenyl-1-phosphate phosphatase
MRLHLFLDFDGTISIGDVGDKLVGTFGSFDLLHDELLSGEFTVAEYYRRAIRSFTSEATPDAVEVFANSQHLDAGLVPLLEWSRAHSIPATVVSDGFDVYIRPLLKRELGEVDLPIVSNTLS